MKFLVPHIKPNHFELTDVANSNLIKQIEKNALTVLDLSQDGIGVQAVKRQFDYLGFQNRIIYLTSSFAESNSNDIIFFPHFFYTSNRQFQNQQLTPIGKRPRRASCLNRNGLAHRIYLYYKLLQQPYSKDLLLSCHGLLDPYTHRIRTLDDPIYAEIPRSVKNELAGIKLTRSAFENDNPKTTGTMGDHSWTNSAFQDCYLNIITESTATLSFVSEKTFKPLAAGQLFLMVNGYNSLDILREMGFETFDQDFDNHGYDLFTEFKKSDYIFRIDKLIDLLNRRYDQIEDIYFKNIEGIRYNQEYARSDQLAEDILAPLRKIGIVAK